MVRWRTLHVGGGYPDSGLSDQALIWMVARIQALIHRRARRLRVMENLPNWNWGAYQSGKRLVLVMNDAREVVYRFPSN